MAAASAGASLSSSSTSSGVGRAGAAAFNPFDLSSDPPPPILLSRDQLKYCSEAFAFFKKKLKNPAKISQEFDRLQIASSGRVSRFIATQGPLPETSEDFWEMIIQYRCPVIVMLTLVDNPKVHEAVFFHLVMKDAVNHLNVV
ncbi:hypothetical protein COCNU_15G002700 [Cocos nucifera]|uniref:Tyrosine-protein phosphatase domain-containing protein n=1 Tax=Cocos nucifera TaxID=13894 RepID=A0A8K0IWX5_COCNU|nr:hypothetical protein COCNU_15G002700 [Cocos nucifera]